MWDRWGALSPLAWAAAIVAGLPDTGKIPISRPLQTISAYLVVVAWPAEVVGGPRHAHGPGVLPGSEYDTSDPLKTVRGEAAQ